MKKLFSIAVAVGAFALSVLAGPNPAVLINGPAYTNSTQIVGATTNQIGVVKATATNNFNLAIGSSGASSSSYLISGSQANTNQWPCAGVNCNAGYPNTLYAPFKYLTLVWNGQIMATNATGSQSIITRLRFSMDGTTNTAVPAVVLQANATANTTQYSVTNTIDTLGWPYVLIDTMENTNATASTNNYFIVNGKPGGL